MRPLSFIIKGRCSTLEQWSKEGVEGQKRLLSWLAAVQFCLVLSGALGGLWSDQQSITPGSCHSVDCDQFNCWYGILVWIGEQITSKGIGNGISLIIFAGIVSRLLMECMLFSNICKPARLTFWTWFCSRDSFGDDCLLLKRSLAVFAKIGSICKRVVGRKMYGGHTSYIP